MQTKTREQPTRDSEQRPTRQHLQAVLGNYQNILGNAEDAKSGDPEARRKVLAAIEQLRGLAFERDKQARRLHPKLAPGPDPAVHRWPATLLSSWSDWPEDAAGCLGEGARIESLLQTPYHAGMRRHWRESLADLREATDRLGEILGPQPGPAAKPDPVLEEIDWKILKTLGASGLAVKLADLAITVVHDRDTCSKHLRETLIPFGYAERKGKRGGFAISPPGRERLNRPRG